MGGEPIGRRILCSLDVVTVINYATVFFTFENDINLVNRFALYIKVTMQNNLQKATMAWSPPQVILQNSQNFTW